MKENPLGRGTTTQEIRKACLQRATVYAAESFCSPLDLICLMVLTYDNNSL